ncbi:MAG: riboflavin synthase [Chitinispirillaceae bacterium]|nr:riboflavin synthase [Chitinispirillaceae bacterium]
MFTGLIETLGTIVLVKRSGVVCRIAIVPDKAGFTVAVGGSVSVDGACLTLEGEKNGGLCFAAVQETLDRTTLKNARAGGRVNLERPLALGQRIDGHMVLGHVDGTGSIRERRDGKEASVIAITVPPECASLMAVKGSVAVDGISLTIAALRDGAIEVALVPATLEKTTLGGKNAGDSVNIEADVIARYVERCVAVKPLTNGNGTLFEKLERLGY